METMHGGIRRIGRDLPSPFVSDPDSWDYGKGMSFHWADQ